MKEISEKLLKQSAIVLVIVLIFILCSSIFGSISMISKMIQQSQNAGYEFSDKIVTGKEVSDVEGYGNIVYGIGAGFSYFSTIILYVIRTMMQIGPVILFASATISNLIAWLFNLGKPAVWKRNTGIVFWSLNLAKLLLILIIAGWLVIDSKFQMPFLSYSISIIIIALFSIVYQVVLMIKNIKILKMQ